MPLLPGISPNSLSFLPDAEQMPDIFDCLNPFRVPIDNLTEHFRDNFLRAKVKPVIGSVVYCDLVFGYIEHSGIYIGNGEIVALEKDGCIVSRSAREFMKGTTALRIYVSCHDGHAVGDPMAANRARQKLGCHRDYSVLFNNCHQFTTGCLTGDFETKNTHGLTGWAAAEPAFCMLSSRAVKQHHLI